MFNSVAIQPNNKVDATAWVSLHQMTFTTEPTIKDMAAKIDTSAANKTSSDSVNIESEDKTVINNKTPQHAVCHENKKSQHNHMSHQDTTTCQSCDHAFKCVLQTQDSGLIAAWEGVKEGQWTVCAHCLTHVMQVRRQLDSHFCSGTSSHHTLKCSQLGWEILTRHASCCADLPTVDLLWWTDKVCK